jgi:glycosyltransferase involved in cell wall biosynthesis
MTTLKVMFVIDSLGTGGAEYDLWEKLPWLASFNITPLLVSLRSRSEGVQQDVQRQGFDVRILNEKRLLSRVLALRRIIRKERPDVIRTVLFHADIAGRLAAIGTGIPVLSRIVNTDYAEIRRKDPNLDKLRFRLARMLDRWTALYLTARLYANSNAVKASTVRDLGVPAEKITVIGEAREPHRLGEPGAERRRRARLQLGVGVDQPVLVNVGRQDYQKGQRYLLEAVRKLLPAYPRLAVLIAGRSGDASDALERMRQQLQVSDNVTFLGHRRDIPELLAAADLFVFPSLYEGSPGAVIEAMALGLPIVAFDIDPVREIVEEESNALLVEMEAPDQLAGAIDRLLRDRETARSFGERSRRIFGERFTLAASLAREIELYREFAEGRRPGGGGHDTRSKRTTSSTRTRSFESTARKT